jgi:hypothetical protein
MRQIVDRRIDENKHGESTEQPTMFSKSSVSSVPAPSYFGGVISAFHAYYFLFNNIPSE